MSAQRFQQLVFVESLLEMRIIAFVPERATIDRILSLIGEPTAPPPIAPARAPRSSVSDLDQTPPYTLDAAEPVPEFEFDQVFRGCGWIYYLLYFYYLLSIIHRSGGVGDAYCSRGRRRAVGFYRLGRCSRCRWTSAISLAHASASRRIVRPQ